MPVGSATVRAITDLEAAVRFFAQLGYQVEPRPMDPSELGLGSYTLNRVLKSHSGMRRGYGVFLTETDRLPRSFVPFGRRLLEGFHDHPLAVIGERGMDGRWQRFVVLRPRLIVRVFKIEVSVTAPTHHDCEVLDGLRWDDHAPDPQEQVDRAFDIEEVTRRFFSGLREHTDRLAQAISDLTERKTYVRVAVDRAGGTDRLTIRIVSQLLFCWFLQRKGMLGGDRSYLVSRWHRRRGPYYASELKPLFYETLGIPIDRRAPGRPGREIPFDRM